MPKNRGAAPVLGRAQEGRPRATPDAPKLAEGPRALQGALSLPLRQIVPDPDQPRRTVDPEALAELAESMRQRGVLQAILVREGGFADDGAARYVIVDGERRWRAARDAGLDRLPALVQGVSDARDVRILQLIANLQRQDLDPLEEAVAFRDLIRVRALSTRDAGALVGRSHMYVQRRLDLLFDERLADAVRAGRLNATTASEIKSLPAPTREEVIRIYSREGQ